jgi:hypothetical protein
MGRSTGMGLRRAEPLPLYLSKREKALLVKLKTWSNVSMVEFVRCMTFDYSFESIGGQTPKRKALVAQPVEKRDVPIPLYLSKLEKARLRKLAKAASDIPMVEFIRCKTFGYRLDSARATTEA